MGHRWELEETESSFLVVSNGFTVAQIPKPTGIYAGERNAALREARMITRSYEMFDRIKDYRRFVLGMPSSQGIVRELERIISEVEG